MINSVLQKNWYDKFQTYPDYGLNERDAAY